MPRTHPAKSKYPYQPTIGVKSDFETLLQRFSSAGTVRYEKFAECWRVQNMACYCAGRQTKREAREFVEQCFVIATQFWLPPSSFLVRAGALYLLYGLYYFQLVVPKVKIRITPNQWKTILEFQQEAREQQHLDLDYVFQKLMLEKAFIFVAMPDEECLSQKGSEDSRIIPESMKEETSMLDEVFSSSALNQLSLVHDQYQKMKVALNGEDATQPDTSLNIVHADLLGGIYKTLQTHKDRQTVLLKGHAFKSKMSDTLEEDDSTITTSDTISVKKHLKQKAFQLSAGGYRKKGKGSKHKGVFSDETTSSDDNQPLATVTTGPVRLPGKPIRYSLYDKDECENAPVALPQIHEVFCMPDLDTILPKPAAPTENSTGEEDAESSEESDIKTKLKRKANKNSKDNKSVPVNAEKEITGEPKTKPPKAKKAKVSAKNKETKIEKKTENKLPDKPKELKARMEQSKNNKDLGEKEPTAQEKLQFKLTKRKKDARLKAKKAGKLKLKT